MVLVVKNTPEGVSEHACNNAGDIRDTDSVSGSGRSSGGEHGNPLTGGDGRTEHGPGTQVTQGSSSGPFSDFCMNSGRRCHLSGPVSPSYLGLEEADWIQINIHREETNR